MDVLKASWDFSRWKRWVDVPVQWHMAEVMENEAHAGLIGLEVMVAQADQTQPLIDNQMGLNVTSPKSVNTLSMR